MDREHTFSLKIQPNNDGDGFVRFLNGLAEKT